MCIRILMANAIYQVIDTLLGRPLTQVEFDGERDARATVHPPEKHADAFLRGLGKPFVIQQQLPVECPPFRPKWRIERVAALALISAVHYILQVVARYQLV